MNKQAHTPYGDQWRTEVMKMRKADIVEMLQKACEDRTRLESEIHAYREGGVTEEILRRNDGYIKLGAGCVIALASDMEPDLPAIQQGSE